MKKSKSSDKLYTVSIRTEYSEKYRLVAKSSKDALKRVQDTLDQNQMPDDIGFSFTGSKPTLSVRKIETVVEEVKYERED